MLGILIKARLKRLFSLIIGLKKVERFLSIVVLGFVGFSIPIVFYMFLEQFVVALVAIDLLWVFFAMIGFLLFSLCFIGSIFLVQQELYGAKDNDLLLSFPLKARDILLSRLLSVLLFNYVYVVFLLLPVIVVCIGVLHFSIIQLLYTMIVFITFPILTMTFTCMIGYVIALIMSKGKYKMFVQFILYIVFFVIYMVVVSRYGDLFRLIMLNIDLLSTSIKTYLPPLYYMSKAIIEMDFMMLCIYLAMVFIPFIIVVCILERNFYKIITAKKEVYTVKDKTLKHQRSHYFIALMKKDVKHFFSNVTVILNGLLGSVLLFIGSIFLIYQRSDILYYYNDIRLFEHLVWAIVGVVSCLIMYLCSLNFYTAFSISLEGKTFPLTKSLPVQVMDILIAKLLLHLLFVLPVSLFSSISAIILFQFNVAQSLVVIVLPVLFTLFVALVGLLLNVCKPSFDWVSEAACAKRSLPVFGTLLISIIMMVFFGYMYYLVYDLVSLKLFLGLCIIVLCLINVLLYLVLDTYGVRKFNQL